VTPVGDPLFDRQSTLSAVLGTTTGRQLIEQLVPGLAASPQLIVMAGISMGRLAEIIPTLRDDPLATERLWESLAALDEATTTPPYPAARTPDPNYDPDARPASAHVTLPGPTPRWGIVEISLDGPSRGNPFVDVELTAQFRHGELERTIGGFYDGQGIFRLRLLAEAEGTWEFTTTSNAPSLNGLTGVVVVVGPAANEHGPVHVDGFHFRHADGTRHRPLGTTAYAWTHQGDLLEEQTLATLASAPFNKIRMCLFPKSYQYNANDPERFVFPRSLDGGEGHAAWDTERFDMEYFRYLEQRIAQLNALHIQADLILFHPYDRWGFSDLGSAANERYVRYVVRRLAAFANVWWSLANEYDLVWSKTVDDWERLAAIVIAEDPHDHLISNHNCGDFYDYSKPWITHCSMQRVDVYRTAENTDAWREQWGKPVVIDECAYEGDIDQGWGNITGEEMVRRFWEGAVRGGYVGHGETYLNEREELWWSKGGELVGSSPDRIAFLERILAESPTGVLDPLLTEWDVPWGGVAGRYLIGYFGFNRPRFRNVVLPAEGEFFVDILDTWGMTIERLPGTHTGTVRVELPGRQYMAIRVSNIQDALATTT
jgi:Domain of unknown function (DUF5605)/Domain of unknown function (DUF5060)/Protein of unknown function (DUF4038)